MTFLKGRRDVLDSVKQFLESILTRGVINRDDFKRIAKDVVAKTPAEGIERSSVIAAAGEMIIDTVTTTPEQREWLKTLVLSEAVNAGESGVGEQANAAPTKAPPTDAATDDSAEERQLTLSGLVQFIAEARLKRAQRRAATNDVNQTTIVGSPSNTVVCITGFSRVMGQGAQAAADASEKRVREMFPSVLQCRSLLYSDPMDHSEKTMIGSVVALFPTSPDASSAVQTLLQSQDLSGTIIPNASFDEYCAQIIAESRSVLAAARANNARIKSDSVSVSAEDLYSDFIPRDVYGVDSSTLLQTSNSKRSRTEYI